MLRSLSAFMLSLAAAPLSAHPALDDIALAKTAFAERPVLSSSLVSYSLGESESRPEGVHQEGHRAVILFQLDGEYRVVYHAPRGDTMDATLRESGWETTMANPAGRGLGPLAAGPPVHWNPVIYLQVLQEILEDLGEGVVRTELGDGLTQFSQSFEGGEETWTVTMRDYDSHQPLLLSSTHERPGRTHTQTWDGHALFKGFPHPTTHSREIFGDQGQLVEFFQYSEIRTEEIDSERFQGMLSLPANTLLEAAENDDAD